MVPKPTEQNHYNVVYGLGRGLAIMASDAYISAASLGTIRHTNLGDFYSDVPPDSLVYRIFEVLKQKSGQTDDTPGKLSLTTCDLAAKFEIADTPVTGQIPQHTETDKIYVIRELFGVRVYVPDIGDDLLEDFLYRELSAVFLPEIYDKTKGGSYLQTVREVRKEQSKDKPVRDGINADLAEIGGILERLDQIK